MAVSATDGHGGRILESSGETGARFDASLMARALGALLAAGATLALLTVAVPHTARSHENGLLVAIGGAYLLAAVLLWRGSGVSRRVFPYALAWGSTVITGVAYLSAQSPSPMVFCFLWICLCASYFLSTAEAAAQIVYVGLLYGALLTARTPDSGVAEWWLVGMGTLFVASVLISSMRERVELLISRLYDTARRDSLTELPNRQGFRELLDLDLERARRSKGMMSMLVGRIDNFSELNDRLGRAAADDAVKRVARGLDAGRRQVDSLARVGGEEFALILPDADLHHAIALAEQLREGVRREFTGDPVPLTMSFGVASYPDHCETAASLLRAADEALFSANESGGDRTVLYSQALRGSYRPDADARDAGGERFVAAILDLAEAVDLRFSGSARHSETVGRYAEMMARELGFTEEHVARVKLAGMLHDVGKVGVPDEILQKPGKLTDEEFEVIKSHPGLGEQILEHPRFHDVRRWVGMHHERPDGRGYPRQLSGDDIPVEARILAVADAYEAMTSDRSYRDALGHAAATAELERCADTQFDPRVTRALIEAIEREGEQAEEDLIRRSPRSPRSPRVAAGVR
jgi:diguanylate cyclase (GGDEF)-like protein/putative nucleotidyltransferase with HDIG domain